MTVRFYVTCAALMICSWLAATYLRAVPMDSYPGPPAFAVQPGKPTGSSAPILAAKSEGESTLHLISTGAQ